jgi:tetratricopeptide (TPR) repeat protein
MKHLNSILLIWLGCLVPVFGSNPSDLVERGNQAYIRGEFSYAAELYEKVLELGYTAPELHYNLGNAYYKHNDISRAILHYERGLRLRPSDEALKYNLNRARQRIVDRIDPMPEIFLERWTKMFFRAMPADGWARTGISLFLSGLAGMLGFFFSRRMFIKKLAFFLALGMLFLSSIAFISARRQFTESKKMEAILFVPRTTAKSAPGSESPDLFVIHEGSKMEITSELGVWVEIRLANGNVGWIKREALEFI